MTNANVGGYEPRFNVTRTDGRPIEPSRRYMVLDFSGADPEAVEALRLYAQLKSKINPQLAVDLRRHINNPADAPSQHGGA